jgi:hypothetical protein
LVAGLCAGLALDSKYTAGFLWIGLGVWVIVTPSLRVWLRRWQPYVGGLLGLLLFAPVLAWNAAHDWAGLLKQGSRVEDWRPTRAIGFLAELVGGQAGLATPVIFGLCMIGLVIALRRGWLRGDPRWSLLASFSAPPLLVFLQHALGDRVQGNWPAIIYPALALAAGGASLPRRWVSAGLAIGFGVTALAYTQATTHILPLPPRLDPVSLRLGGWKQLAEQVAGRRGEADFLAVEGYGPASELAWWSSAPVLGADERRWRLTALPEIPVANRSGLLLRGAGDANPPDPALWSSAVLLSTMQRPGAPKGAFALFRVTGAGGARLAVLPVR